MGALRSLFDDGLVRMVGISNADIAQIDAARAIFGDALVSVQNQFSPGWRSSADELAHCAALGLAWLPWSPFGGVGRPARWTPTAPAFAEVADELGVSVYRVTLAWHLAQADVVVPIPGASRPESIVDSAAAADLQLSDDQLARLNATRPDRSAPLPAVDHRLRARDSRGHAAQPSRQTMINSGGRYPQAAGAVHR